MPTGGSIDPEIKFDGYLQVHLCNGDEGYSRGGHDWTHRLCKIAGDARAIDGGQIFKHACKVGLEGVVSKVRDSRDRRQVSGRQPSIVTSH